MENRTYDMLLNSAKIELSSTKRLFGYVSVFEPEDLVHGFVASVWFDDEVDWQIMKLDFDRFIARKIRDAKRRRDKAVVISESDNYVFGNFDGSFHEEDLIEGYMYRHRPIMERRAVSLHEGYDRGDGSIDYDLMLEDMHKVMLEHDRAMCITNRNTKRSYVVGDPMAIPIERLYNRGEFMSKGEV